MKSVHKIAAATQQKCSRFFTKDIATNGTRAKENILTLQITVFNTLKQKQMRCNFALPTLTTNKNVFLPFPTRLVCLKLTPTMRKETWKR